LDHDQPRIGGCTPRSRFRHYVNLRHTEAKLEHLLRCFRFGTMSDTLDAFHQRDHSGSE
jgi:hypothetical protein